MGIVLFWIFWYLVFGVAFWIIFAKVTNWLDIQLGFDEDEHIVFTGLWALVWPLTIAGGIIVGILVGITYGLFALVKRIAYGKNAE